VIDNNSYEVTILGQRFTVEHVQNLLVEGERCEGACYVSERVIKLDDYLRFQESRYNRVLRHELMHAALRVSGLAELMELKMEEAICVLAESVSIK
tara:strand:+ start:3942 stop:4229 length:288 start_codon:yes stop_codon:yes gene_type:complete